MCSTNSISRSLQVLSRIYTSGMATFMAIVADQVLVYLTEGEDSISVISLVIEHGFIKLFMQILTEYSNPNYLHAAVRAAGNIATGTDEQTQSLIDHGILPVLEGLLDQSKEAVVREVCWLISNITAGNQSQLEIVVKQNLEIFAKLNRSIIGNTSQKVRKEATWSVCNALTGSSNEQLKKIVETGCIPAICYMLYVQQDEKLLMTVLSALRRVLDVGAEEYRSVTGRNVYEILIEECGGLEKFFCLKNHQSSNIRFECYEILGQHFADRKTSFNISSSTTSKKKSSPSPSGRNSPICIIFKRDDQD
uniref:Uncharacterized protein n=1 Tax=Romanomermis culicivorax TaxID=13658 RepID=A0A915HRL8_ROMCU